MRLYFTSPGGRVFAGIVALFTGAMGAAAFAWAIRIFGRGIVSFSIGRGSSRGVVTLDGFTAYLYAGGMLLLATSMALYTAAMLYALFSRRATHGAHALACIKWGYYLLLPSAAFALLAIVIDLFT